VTFAWGDRGTLRQTYFRDLISGNLVTFAGGAETYYEKPRNIRCSDQDSNREPPKFKLEETYSVIFDIERDKYCKEINKSLHLYSWF
jgi:hypothetical protein